MILTNNIWKIFYAMLLGALFLLSSMLYSVYTDISERHHSQIEHYTSIVENAIHADLYEKEIMLNFIGHEILNQQKNNTINYISTFLDNFLAENRKLAGLGFIGVDGKFRYYSSNLNNLNLENVNFLQDENTKQSFTRVLSSEQMLLGRTYYFEAIKKWVIPFRKTIRDKNGTALGVMSTGLQLQNSKNYLIDTEGLENKEILIIRSKDKEGLMYRQYYSKKGINFIDYYNTPVSNEQMKLSLKEIQYRYPNLTLEKLRKEPKSISFLLKNSKNITMLYGLKFDPIYRHWILIESTTDEIRGEFLTVVYIYISLFVIVLILFFILFKKIATSENKKSAELIYQAEHDLLTELPNRVYMYKHIIEWRKYHSDKFHIIYIDLDNFKNINDKFGHKTGDKVLVQVSKRLKKFISQHDMLIRQGGDEFILLTKSRSEHKLDNYLKSLITIVSKEYFIDDKEFRIGLSIGVARYPLDASNVEELLSLADTAMYEAKKVKNTYSLFSENLRHQTALKADMEQELRAAIKKNELYMVYQPQITLKDGSIYGVEALVRWENKKLGYVGPDKFIAIAEQTGLIMELGEFIIRRAFDELNSIKEKIKQELRLSINISVVQFMEKSFLEDLLTLIELYEFNKKELTLELTESLSIEDLDEVLPLLNAVRAEGIEISLDDFGTGYSSLSMLRELPIDELKIDKSFIDTIVEDEKEKSLVRNIINIGENFSMKTLAEGVETQEQVRILKENDCDIIQGYYYSKPLKYEKLLEYLLSMKS